KKGAGNFSAWVIEACRRRLTADRKMCISRDLI
ncbi:TPA: DUF3950 domain-containing protein, partial [Escherichia coli]|nr:DUF3950 domain-containing protein [Escherichia coli]